MGKGVRFSAAPAKRMVKVAEREVGFCEKGFLDMLLLLRYCFVCITTENNLLLLHLVVTIITATIITISTYTQVCI